MKGRTHHNDCDYIAFLYEGLEQVRDCVTIRQREFGSEWRITDVEGGIVIPQLGHFLTGIENKVREERGLGEDWYIGFAELVEYLDSLSGPSR